MKRPFSDFEINDLEIPLLESEPLHVRYKPNPPTHNEVHLSNFDNFNNHYYNSNIFQPDLGGVHMNNTHSHSHDLGHNHLTDSHLSNSQVNTNHLMIDIDNDFDYTCLFLNDDFTTQNILQTPLTQQQQPQVQSQTQQQRQAEQQPRIHQLQTQQLQPQQIPVKLHTNFRQIPPTASPAVIPPLSIPHTIPPTASTQKKTSQSSDSAQYTPYYMSNYSKGGQGQSSSSVSSVPTPSSTPGNNSYYNEKDTVKGEKICWSNEMVIFLIEQYAKNVTRSTVISPNSDKKNDISFSDLGVPYCGWNSISKSLSDNFQMKISSKACKNKFVKLKLEFTMTNLCEEIKKKLENLSPKEKEKELEKLYQQEPKIKRYITGNYKFQFFKKMLELLPTNNPPPSAASTDPVSTSPPPVMEEISPCGTVCNLKLNCPNAKKTKNAKETPSVDLTQITTSGTKPPESKGIDDPRLHHIFYHNIFLQEYAVETGKGSSFSKNFAKSRKVGSNSSTVSTPLYPSAIKSSAVKPSGMEPLTDIINLNKNSIASATTTPPESSLNTSMTQPSLTSSPSQGSSVSVNSQLSIDIHNRISKEISDTVSNMMSFMKTSMLRIETLLKERDLLLPELSASSSEQAVSNLPKANGLDSLINAAQLADS